RRRFGCRPPRPGAGAPRVGAALAPGPGRSLERRGATGAPHPVSRRVPTGRTGAPMRLIQHKKEAYWFYRFLSLGYDRWVNPLFWTPEMRAEALARADLDDADLTVVDVGAGTGFTTEGVVERVAAANVTMLDQSPHQLAR